METKAKDYFDKEYDKDHIQGVINMNDIVSLYGLMEEFAEYYHNEIIKDCTKCKHKYNTALQKPCKGCVVDGKFTNYEKP